MELSRRDFFKLSGASVAGLIVYKALSADEAGASIAVDLHKPIGECPTICPFDGSGCGFIVATDNDEKVLNIEGDPEHPINHGAGCAKGSSIRQIAADNPRRLTKPQYRRPGGTEWEDISWDDALNKIAQNIKATRDANWIPTDDGYTSNRTEAIANLGGAALDNEECYLLAKMARGLGVVYLEHQARI